MTPAKLSRQRFELRDRKPGGITTADQCAGRCPGDGVNGNRIFFERAQNSDMRNPARRAAGKRQADAWTIQFFGLSHQKSFRLNRADDHNLGSRLVAQAVHKVIDL